MSDDFIPVGDTGKNLNTRTTTTGAGEVHDEVVQLSSRTGISTMVGPFAETLVGYKRDDVSVDFQYDFLNTFFDCKEPTVTGDGATAVADSVLTVSSASSGTSEVQSRDTIRYIPGHSGFADFTFSASGSSGIARAGCFDSEDGFFVERDFDADKWYFKYRRDGVDSTGVEISTDHVADDDLRIFRIWFGYLGVANPVLMTKNGDWRTIAVIETETGNSGDTHVLRPEFPICVYAENGASAGAASWNGGTIGNGAETKGNRTFAFPNQPLVNGTALEDGTMTLSGTTVGTICIIRLKDTYKSKTNKVKGRLLKWQCSVLPVGTGNGEVLLQLIALPTLTGTPTYSDVNTDNSTVEIDHTAGTGASVSYSSGGRVLLQQEVIYDSGGFFSPSIVSFSTEDAERLGLVGYPGNTFCVVAKDRGGNNITVRTEINWEELF